MLHVSRMLSGDSGDSRQSGSTGPKGGQFAPGGGRVTGKGKKPSTRRPGRRPAAKPGPPRPLGYNGKTGTGYGIKGGDSRVRSLQAVLNRFGLTDSHGRALAVDGKYGPLTTSAVKKLQKAMGVEANGVVDDAFLKRVSSAKSLNELRPAKPTKAAPRKTARRPVPQRQGYRETGRSMLPDFMDPGDADEFGDGFEDVPTSPPTDRHVLDNGICVTCKMREQMSEPHVLDNGVCVTCESARSVQALVDALDEVLRTRYVRTPAGAKKYGLPIGSPIGGDHTPHVPKPHTPGKKGTLKDRLAEAINDHFDGKGDGDPLKDFNREQLRQVAKQRGIKLDRGEDRDSIAKKLLAHAGGTDDDSHHAPAKHTPPKPVEQPVKKVTPAKVAPKPAKKTTPPLSQKTLGELSDEQIANGITMHGTDSPKGKLLAAEQARRQEAAKATAAPAAKPSPKIAKLQGDLARIREEALPIAIAHNKWMDGDQIDSSEQDVRTRQLKKLRAKAEPAADQLLDALIERDGSPFGGDPDADADRWVNPKDWDVTSRRVGAPPPDWKVRDRYVVGDTNTIKQNASLRSGEPTPAAKRWAGQMRKLARTNELNHDSKLYRGAAMPPEQIAALRPGAVIHDLGIMSTDMNPQTASLYADTRMERTPGAYKTLFELRAPKGTPAMNVGAGEIVLDHGTRWRVVSSRMTEGDVDFGLGRGKVVHVVMEYVGGDP